jgi:hypothetical protein
MAEKFTRRDCIEMLATQRVLTPVGEVAVMNSVKSFGAFGDGVHDDTAAIQAAIDALSAIGSVKGGIVYFPVGRYRLTAPMQINNNTSCTPIILQGYQPAWGERSNDVHINGVGSVLVSDYAGNTITVTNTTHITIRGLAFEGSGAGYHVQFVGGPGAVTQILIEDCSFQDKVSAIYGADVGSNHIYIRRCSIDGQTGSAVELASTGGNNMWHIEENYITRTGLYGISLYSTLGTDWSANVTVSKNQISELAGVNAAGIFASGFDSLTIDGNDIENITDATGYGIKIYNCRGFLIQGNYFGGHSGWGGVPHPILCGDGCTGGFIGPNVAKKRFLGVNGMIYFDAGVTNTVVLPQFTDFPWTFSQNPANTTNTIYTDTGLFYTKYLGIGNSAAAATLGSVVKKMEVFSSTGVSLGFIPIYDAIT